MGALEALGLLRATKDDTLSEYVWSKTKVSWFRGVVAALMAWLTFHFSYGNGAGGLALLDGIFAAIGFVMGWLSARRRTDPLTTQ